MAVSASGPVPLPAPDQSTLIDQLLDEGPLGVCEIARLAGKFRRGRPTHASTVTRWITVGVALEGGAVLKLEGVRLNGRWVSSRAALVRFIAAQQVARASGRSRTAPVQVARRNRDVGRASERAASRLEAAGI